MFKNETEVINWISGQLRFGIRPGLTRMAIALEKLGNPHLQLKTLHIAGTNGKGSTVTFLRSVLQEAGYQVGTYTSPYIETFNERISLNDIPISGADLVVCANKVYPIVEEINQTDLAPFTEFELITLLSFIYFQTQQVDIVVYEVGMGGRLDATNVILPLACGITNVGHDHQEILGDTLEKLAYEKLGIVKKNIPLFTTEERSNLLTLFKEHATKKQSSMIQSLVNYPPQHVKINDQGAIFDWPKLNQMTISMKGNHQIKNATLAYSMIEYLRENQLFTINDASIYEGMRKAFWKGRFEVVQQKPIILLDGAHNIEGVEGLCETLKTIYPNKRYHFVVSILKNKDYLDMFEVIKQTADKVYFTSFDHPNSQTAVAQYEAFNDANSGYKENCGILLNEIIPTLTGEDCLVITGSLYFISQMRKYFM